MNIRDELLNLQDEKYKDFFKRLVPTVDENTIIGVRTPELRKLSKIIIKTVDTTDFLADLPHKFYEENNLHASIIESIGDYEEALKQTEFFLPYIDNWATCDMFVPKVFKKNTDKLILEIDKWIKSDMVYTVRFGIGLLMGLYLDDKFSDDIINKVSQIKSDEYYVNMMIAWFFATALAKQYDSTIEYISSCRLDKWTHNKAIQKACESRRISLDTKSYLRNLKIK